jgi:4-aminobutyrate aminotransferase
MCVAKGIASGVPLGLMVARASIIDRWKPGAHGNTYGGNPLACTAALTTIKLVEEGYMQNAAEIGDYLLDAMVEMQGRHPSIGDVRGKGLMIGIEFVKDKKTQEPAKELRDAVVHGCYERGLLTLGCGRSATRFMPPLMLPKNLADEALEILEDALTEAEGKHL